MTVACVTLGALIVAMTVFDVIVTVLHPGVESPFSNRFQRMLWQILRLFANLPRRTLARGALLGWGLPLMVAGLISLWLALLIVGFALIYFPWIGDSGVFTSEAGQLPTFFTALYYSGVTAATLGFGDVLPTAPVFRLLSVLEALFGFVTVSFSVTYVLSVYPMLSRRRQYATALDAETGGVASALPMVRRYLGDHGSWQNELADRLRDLAMELLAMTESHEQYPVLYYAHAPYVQHSFLRMLVLSRSLIGLLRYGLHPERQRAIVFHPHVLLLEQALHYSLRRLSASLHIPAPVTSDVNKARADLAEEYTRLQAALRELGLAVAEDDEVQSVPVLLGSRIEEASTASSDELDELYGAARASQIAMLDPAVESSSTTPEEAFITFRLEVDPHIASYAHASGYTLKQATADYEAVWWVGEKRRGE